MSMTIKTRLLGLTLGTLILTGGASAIDSKDNAALRYYRAWAQFDKEDRAMLKEASLGAADPDWAAPEGVTLEWLDSMPTQLLLEASSYSSIDFGIDYAKGPYFLVPHLSAMRTSVFTMVVGARLKLDSGDIDGAVDMIAAGYAMSEHCAHDGILISSLIAHSTFHSVGLISEYAQSQGILTAEHRAQLVDSIERFDQRDPFGIKASVQGERDFMLGWVEARIEEGDRVAVEELLSEMNGADEYEEVAQSLREALDRGDNLQPEIHLAKMFYNRALSSWNKPHADETLAELDTMVKDGGFGPLGALFGPALGRVHERYLDGQRLVGEAIERLAN